MHSIDFYDFTVNGKRYLGPHEGQREILKSGARFKVVCCGRRFGKTIFGVNTLLEHCFANSNHTYWYIAPTYRQAKNIAWRYLMTRIRMFPASERKRFKVNSTDLTIEFPNGSLLELKGVERPDNLLGSGLDGVVLDEYATDVYGLSPVWREVIRPSLSDKKGWAIVISTPRGYNHFYELYQYAQDGLDEDWAAFKMPSCINPVMTEDELAKAKRDSGADLFEQEYMAEFRKRSGLVYPQFDREVHLIESVDMGKLNARWSLEVALDFGRIHPTAGVFILYSPDDIAYQVDEYYESNVSTEKHAMALKAKEDKWCAALGVPRPRVRWGDNQASQTILDFASFGYYITPCVKGRDSVEHGISVVQKRLDLSLPLRKPSYYITKDCPNTLREFENYTYMSGDQSTEESEMMRLAAKKKDAPRKVFDDAMDALRYNLSHHLPQGSLGVVKRSRRVRDPYTGI